MADLHLLLDRADILLEQGRYRDAEINLKQVLEQDPENDYALGLLGRCYLNSGRVDEGIEVIQRAIAIDPNDSFYFYLLGFALYQKDNLQAAKDNFFKAIELYPYNAEYFGMLAHTFIEGKDFEVALDKANEGLAVDPENITCLNARSIALNKLKRTEDAIATMQNALAQDPDNEVTHATVGWNFLEKGKHKEAEHHFLEALRINPNQLAARSGLKESLKSKIPPYRWLLQYSFWMQNKAKRTSIAIPIAIYIAFRILVALSSGLGPLAGIVLALLVGTYLLVVFTTWTVNSIANFFLLFHPKGKHALSNSEKWGAINAVSAIITGIIILSIAGFTTIEEGTGYENLFTLGIICLTLALPLGNIHYPINTRGKHWRELYGILLAALGIVSSVLYFIVPGITNLFVFYLVALLVYNWVGAVRT
jgi:tetratricopeptide (TPR) repeat protein